MKVRTRIFAASVLTTGLITSGVVAATGTATAKPVYCSSSVGCSNGKFVDKGPKVPPGWSDAATKCAGSVALAVIPGAGWAGRAALGAWEGYNACEDAGSYADF